MKRRRFMQRAAAAGLAGTAAASFPAPAISQGRKEWRMVTTWPKGLTGGGEGADLLAELITKGTGGRLTVKVYGAGEIVPALESMEAVSKGTVEMGHGSPIYWRNQVPATSFFGSIPFGLSAQEQNAWFSYAGGQALADEVYRELGCKFFPSGNTGPQMGGWFKRPLNSLSDFKELKMRIGGFGGEVVNAAGGQSVTLASQEILPALTSAQVDAAEWIAPYDDLALRLYEGAKYYYYPGWHAPGEMFDNFINLKAWESLPSDIQEIVRAANGTVNERVLSAYAAKNNNALSDLTSKHGVILKQFPETVLGGLSALSVSVLDDLAAKDPLSKKVLESLLDFRKGAIAWTSLSETTFAALRFLISYSKPDGE